MLSCPACRASEKERLCTATSTNDFIYSFDGHHVLSCSSCECLLVPCEICWTYLPIGLKLGSFDENASICRSVCCQACSFVNILGNDPKLRAAWGLNPYLFNLTCSDVVLIQLVQTRSFRAVAFNELLLCQVEPNQVRENKRQKKFEPSDIEAVIADQHQHLSILHRPFDCVRHWHTGKFRGFSLRRMVTLMNTGSLPHFQSLSQRLSREEFANSTVREAVQSSTYSSTGTTLLQNIIDRKRRMASELNSAPLILGEITHALRDALNNKDMNGGNNEFVPFENRSCIYLDTRATIPPRNTLPDITSRKLFKASEKFRNLGLLLQPSVHQKDHVQLDSGIGSGSSADLLQELLSYLSPTSEIKQMTPHSSQLGESDANVTANQGDRPLDSKSSQEIAGSQTPSALNFGYRFSENVMLGKGNYGYVRLAEHILLGEKVAIKTLRKDQFRDARSAEYVFRELCVHKEMRHPNICSLLQVIHTQMEVHMVLEYCPGGDLFDYIEKCQRLEEEEARCLFVQLLSAISYCHQRGVVHRDIKPENILLDRHGQLKLIDFGFTNAFQDGRRLNSFCGSPGYAAPEMLAQKSYRGPEVDVWAMGVTLFTMVCGYQPFDDPKTARIYSKVASGIFEIPSYISMHLRDLLRKMITVDPELRISIGSMKTHDWVASVFQEPVTTLQLRGDVFKRLCGLGFKEEEILSSLETKEPSAIFAAYFLLKNSDKMEPPGVDSTAINVPRLFPYEEGGSAWENFSSTELDSVSGPLVEKVESEYDAEVSSAIKVALCSDKKQEVFRATSQYAVTAERALKSKQLLSRFSKTQDN